MKTLKFYDIYNSGELDFDNFFRSVEKIGIIIEKETLQYIFTNFYDQAKTGKINYKAWASHVLTSQTRDITSVKPHAYSPSKAGACVQEDQTFQIQRSGLSSVGFPLGTTTPLYEPIT